MLLFSTESHMAINVSSLTSFCPYPVSQSATNVRIFSALFQSMESKNRAALGILKMKKNSNPIFCAIIAQVSWDREIQTCVFIESHTCRNISTFLLFYRKAKTNQSLQKDCLAFRFLSSMILEVSQLQRRILTWLWVVSFCLSSLDVLDEKLNY